MVQRIEPEAETGGPIDRDELLGEAVETYMELAESGHPPEPEEFASRYPDLQEDLVAALEGLALVKGLVGNSGSNGPGHRLEEGRRVAGYRIVREIGRGGMGIVYEAVHVGLDRPVALKVLGNSAAPDSSGRRRFLNEARTAASLHHTHIVPVFDVGQVGGLCYYAMQRIEGSGLDRVLRHLRHDRAVAAGSTHGGSASHRSNRTPAPRPRPEPRVPKLGDDTLTWGGLAHSNGGAAAWLRNESDDEPPPFEPPRGSSYYRWVASVGQQASEALGHAHRSDVIHRDIKPSNLLVDARGMIWVADFGLARRLADPSQTQVDSLLGTPRYMSPEQARTSDIDGRADVYSLGATLYELITLRPPFDGQSAAELIDQIANTEAPRPRRFDPRIPLDLETILLKALAKRPVDRYASADDLAEDLARFLAHEPVKARRIGPVGRLWRFARRHPSITAVSTAAALIVLTTAAVAHVRVRAERDEAVHARKDATEAQARAETSAIRSKKSELAGMDKSATLILQSNHPNRRTEGLNLLQAAANLADDLGPDPLTRARLRDQGVSFLSIRDVEARPPIAASSPHGLAFSPDSRRIAALCDDNELGIWAVDSPEVITPIKLPSRGGRPSGPQSKGRPGFGGGGGIGSSRIATAGPKVAVVRPDGSGLRLFDIAAPASKPDDLPMKGHEVGSILATPDGQTLLVREGRETRGSGGPGRPEADEVRVTLWDRDQPDAPRATLTLPTPKLDPSKAEGLRSPGPALLAIAPDGSLIAMGRINETEVALWNGDGTRHDPPTIDVQVNTSALALGRAGLLAVAGGGEIVIWDLSQAQPKPLPGLGRRQGFVRQLRFSPKDGSLLAAAIGPAGGVELWDLSTHGLVASLSTPSWVDDLAFSPDGQILAATQPGSIASWSIVEPVAQVQLPESGERPSALAFGPGDRLAIASVDKGMAGALRLWGGPGRCPPELHAWNQVRPTSLTFDGEGRLVTLDPTGLRWFSPENPNPVTELAIPGPTSGPPPFPEPGGSRPPASVEADSRRGGGNGIGNGGNGGGRGQSPRGGGDSNSGPVPGGRMSNDRLERNLARSHDGRTLAFLIRSGEILVWRASDPGVFSKLEMTAPTAAGGSNRGGGRIVLDPSGTRLFHVSASGDRLAAYTLVGPSTARLDWSSAEVRNVTSLAISPDGRTLALGERSGEFSLITSRDGTIRRPPALPDDAPGPISSLAFAPNSQVLAVGTRDQVRLWDVTARPQPLVRLPGHRGNVIAIAFDASGHSLAGADEKTIKVWDLARLRLELNQHGLGW